MPGNNKAELMGPPQLPAQNRPRRSSRVAAQQDEHPSHTSSSLRRKRARDAQLPPPPNVTPSKTPSIGTTFSANAQREIVDILTFLQSQGKTNLKTLHDTENGMRLCVTCHHALDDVELPGWVFVPTDLDFFLDAEREDFVRRRRELNATGHFPIRQCPPVGDYVEYCGSYDAYMLRQYGPPTNNWRPGRSTYLPTSKHWHGDPMIALFKAFNALANEDLFPPKLRELNLLYRGHDVGAPQGLTPPDSYNDRGSPQQGPGDAGDSPAAPAPAPAPRSNPGPRGRGRGRPPSSRGGRGKHNRGHGAGHGATQNQGPSTGTRSRKRQLDRRNETPPPQRIEVVTSPWVWGPYKTAEEIGEYLSGQKARMRARIPEERRKELEVAMKTTAARLPSPEETEASYRNSIGHDKDNAYPKVAEWLSEANH
ncbi:MAG: hypothetical protein Q9208_008762 [Pyrenodesmia sp. 3 TL-2023]